MEKETVRRIRDARRSEKLPQEFTPAQVNAALGISWSGNFLAKHRVGNPGNETERFERIRPGLYRLKSN